MAPVDVGGTAEDGLAHAGQLYAALLYGVLLVMVLVLGSWVFLRMSRRYWGRLSRKPAPPTPMEDIWGMHKLPDDIDDSAEGPTDGE